MRSHLLNDTDRKIVRLVAKGRTNAEIAGELHYSTATVKGYLAAIYQRTGAHGRVALMLWAVEHGEIPY